MLWQDKTVAEVAGRNGGNPQKLDYPAYTASLPATVTEKMPDKHSCIKASRHFIDGSRPATDLPGAGHLKTVILNIYLL